MKRMFELAEQLIKNGVDFDHRCTGNFSFVYIHGFKDANDYTPYVRVSVHDGEEGYYCRYNGLILENQSIDDILEMAGKLQSFVEN